MPQGDIVKPGGVLEIALCVPDPVQDKSGLGHSSVHEYLRQAGTVVQSSLKTRFGGATSLDVSIFLHGSLGAPVGPEQLLSQKKVSRVWSGY